VKTFVQTLDSLIAQQKRCLQANPKTPEEYCRNRNCHRCNRGRDFRRRTGKRL